MALSVKYLPHKQEHLSSVYKMKIKKPDRWHVLVIPVPGKQAGRPWNSAGMVLSLRPAGLHSEALSKQNKTKWIATEE